MKNNILPQRWQISGHYRLSANSEKTNPDILVISFINGEWWAIQQRSINTRISCQRVYNETDLPGEYRVVIIDENSEFEFYPADNECERVGLEINENGA